MHSYRFYKNDSGWYVDLPQYLQQGGDIDDLQMVEGADRMLDIIAGNAQELELLVTIHHFQQADRLGLIEKCHPLKGGGYYFLQEYCGQPVNITMWLCSVVEFVFGEVPAEIFIRKL